MSRRTVAIAAALGLAAGLIGGFALGRSTAPEDTLTDQMAELRDDLQPARQGIELTATEYSEAVRGGRVVARTEYQAARQDVQRARSTVLSRAEELRALSRARAAAVERSIDALGAAVTRQADPDDVVRLSRQADAALVAAVGR
jgi:hypothetical protein